MMALGGMVRYKIDRYWASLLDSRMQTGMGGSAMVPTVGESGRHKRSLTATESAAETVILSSYDCGGLCFSYGMLLAPFS